MPTDEESEILENEEIRLAMEEVKNARQSAIRKSEASGEGVQAELLFQDRTEQPAS